MEYATTTPATQSCSITQTNTSGDNIAIVIEVVKHRHDTTQSATQDAGITQHNLSGNNFAAILQFIDQSTSGPGVQSQDNHQFANIDQNDPTVVATATGRNLAILAESSKQFGDSETGPSQVQRSEQDVSDGLHHINQYSQGVSKAFAGQSQVQRLIGDGVQNQTIDPRCCSDQLSNINNVYQIKQNTVQVARLDNGQLNPNANQNSDSTGTCNSTGHCAITQSSSNNKKSFSNTTNCTGFCSRTVFCISNVEFSSCGPGGAAPILGLSSFSGRAVALAEATRSASTSSAPSSRVLLAT